MKKYIYTLLFALPILSSCERELFSYSEDEGKLKINVGIDDNLKVSTRTLTDEETKELTDNCKIRVYDGDNLIRTYQGTSSIPSDGLQLVTGSDYSVRVNAGEAVEASFDKRYFEGTKDFSISKGETTSVDVTCVIKNSVVQVNFDAIASVMKDYVLKVGVTSNNMLEFTAAMDASTRGYFTLPEGTTELKYEFEGLVQGTDQKVTTSGTFDAEAQYLYTLNCTYNDTPTTDSKGGGILVLDVVSTPIETVTSGITIYQPPTIVGMDTENNTFSLSEATTFEVGKGEALTIWMSAACPLSSATIQSDKFSDFGLPTTAIELTDLKTSDKKELENVGITTVTRNAIGSASSGGGNLGIKFSETFMQKLSQTEGTYYITLSAKDQKGSTRTTVWTILVSNDKVQTSTMASGDAWTRQATLRGEILGETDNEVSFQYRKSGDSDWTKVSAVASGNNLSAEITGLTPGTTYEYRILDGDSPKKTCTFTTETLAQPENASFEEWSTASDKAFIPTGGDLWWDTGNHGSITMNKNITSQSTDYVHDGSYCAKLESQFVGIGTVGKFAAGNIFVGKYLKTDGTDGVLGWGRPFSSRPTQMKVWVRYECATVSYTSSELSDFTKGSNDNGQIYIAVGDWAGETYNGETWPVVIKTKSSERQLFDKDADGVIAYGEKTFTESTSGTGLIEVTIDLDYRTLTRRPTDIVIVCSASKYGDYFAGGESKMWIDDIQLIYGK